MDQNQIRTIIGVIGNVISFGLFLSPVPTFYKIWKKKDVQQFSPMPYLATLMNCMLWVFYGLPIVHPNSTLVYTINGIGFVIESIYLTIFFIYSNKQNRLKMTKILAAEFLFMVGVIVVVLTTAHSHEKRTQIVGSLCVIFGTCMYAAPLTVMKLVIQTKSVKYMPFLLSLVCFLNGVCWTTYAVLPFDIFLVIPNGLGAVFGFIQLLLYACFYRTTNWDEEEPSKTKEVEMPSAV